MIDAVVQISTGGRGFIVGLDRALVITASHCLPRLPVPDPGASLKERTFQGLLGPLGGTCDVWAECLYVDPVADLAVLGSPDRQQLGEEAERYDALITGRKRLRVAAAPLAPMQSDKPDSATLDSAQWEGPGRLLALDGVWFDCRLRATRRAFWIVESAQAFAGGMSGSPIADQNGTAIGVLCSTGANPILLQQLPRWLLTEIAESGSTLALREGLIK